MRNFTIFVFTIAVSVLAKRDILVQHSNIPAFSPQTGKSICAFVRTDGNSDELIEIYIDGTLFGGTLNMTTCAITLNPGLHFITLEMDDELKTFPVDVMPDTAYYFNFFIMEIMNTSFGAINDIGKAEFDSVIQANIDNLKYCTLNPRYSNERMDADDYNDEVLEYTEKEARSLADSLYNANIDSTERIKLNSARYRRLRAGGITVLIPGSIILTIGMVVAVTSGSFFEEHKGDDGQLNMGIAIAIPGGMMTAGGLAMFKLAQNRLESQRHLEDDVISR